MSRMRVLAVVFIACVLGSLGGCFALTQNLHLDNGILKDTTNFDDRCTVCEFIVGFILGELGRDRNPDKIRMILETTCDNVPSLLQKTCSDFIKEYAEPLLIAIQQGKTIEKICQELSLCSSQQFTKRKLTIPTRSIPCEMCDSIIQRFNEIQIDGKENNQIVNEMLSVCDTFTTSVAFVCRELVMTNGQLIVTQLKLRVPPLIICQKLNFCHRQLTLSQLVKPLDQIMTEISFVNECVLCEWVVGTTEMYLENTNTQKEIEQFLTKECTRLPKDYVYLCQEFVERYLPTILEYLLNQLPPQRTCSVLRLCPNESTKS